MTDQPGKAKAIPSNRSGMIRKTVLLLVLFFVIGAAIYEYAFARPAYNRISTRMNELVDNPSAANLSSDELQDHLAVKPTRVREIPEKRMMVETYSVQRGLPFTSFNIHVWYMPNQSRWEYAGHKTGKHPTDEELPVVPGSQIVFSKRTDLVIEMVGGSRERSPQPFEASPEDEDSSSGQGADSAKADDKTADDKTADDAAADNQSGNDPNNGNSEGDSGSDKVTPPERSKDESGATNNNDDGDTR